MQNQHYRLPDQVQVTDCTMQHLKPHCSAIEKLSLYKYMQYCSEKVHTITVCG